jgi:hypothetical protein
MFELRQPTVSQGKNSEGRNMSKKLGSWLILLGALVALLGLCVLPAALRNGSDKSLLPVGMAVFSMGILLVAGGTYSKALGLQSDSSPRTTESSPKSRGGCDRCHTETPAVQCKVHQMHLCDTCLESHYDFRSCVYVPSTRRIAGRAVKVLAAKR